MDAEKNRCGNVLDCDKNYLQEPFICSATLQKGRKFTVDRVDDKK